MALTVIPGSNPETRYHYLHVSHVEPGGQSIPALQGPILRRPVIFAGKRPEVLKQALGEADEFFEALLIPAGHRRLVRSVVLDRC